MGIGENERLRRTPEKRVAADQTPRRIRVEEGHHAGKTQFGCVASFACGYCSRWWRRRGKSSFRRPLRMRPLGTGEDQGLYGFFFNATLTAMARAREVLVRPAACVFPGRSRVGVSLAGE